MKMMKHFAAALLLMALTFGGNAFAENEQSPQTPMPTAPGTGSAVQPPSYGEIIYRVVQALVF